jgi:hypothetical protein
MLAKHLEVAAILAYRSGENTHPLEELFFRWRLPNSY